MRKNVKTLLVLIMVLQLGILKASGESENDKGKRQREAPSSASKTEGENDSVNVKETPFKPSFNLGSIVHMYAGSQQSGFLTGGSTSDASKDWNTSFTLYRARILVGGKLSKNGSFFLETELPSPVGIRNADGSKNVKVAPIILDAQYEHDLGNNQMIVAGKQLVSHNRNGLQGAASLMANDFTFFQYPYNLFENQALQGNFGRDIGVNYRGFVADEKLEYRLGVFSGRTFADGFTPRITGRVVYNFLDAEKDYYYAGTKLGNGKTVALAGGFDLQGTYINTGLDLYVDVPVGEAGSVTLNSAFSYMTGGTDTTSNFSFTTLIPAQNTQFLELGYYFKKSKLQPWIRYERQGMSTSDLIQTNGVETDQFNDLNSTTIFGGGLNYWFSDYNTNLRLSYTTWNTKALNEDNEATSTSYGQLWLQLQFFLF